MKRTFINGIINIIVLFFLTFLFFIGFYETSMNTNNYIFITLISICCLIFICKTFISKHKFIYNISQFIIFIINIILCYQIILINDQYNYIENLFKNNYQYTEYSIYILKKNPIYLDIEKLNNKNIGILTTNSKNVENIFKNEIKANYKVYNNTNEIIKNITEGNVQSFIISEKEYAFLIKNNPTIAYSLKNVYTIKVKEEINNNL